MHILNIHEIEIIFKPLVDIVVGKMEIEIVVVEHEEDGL